MFRPIASIQTWDRTECDAWPIQKQVAGEIDGAGRLLRPGIFSSDIDARERSAAQAEIIKTTLALMAAVAPPPPQEKK